MYVLLAGRPPFGSTSDLNSLLESIVYCKYDRCEAADWKPISADAKSLIPRLLERSPYQRLTAEQVLEQPSVHACIHTCMHTCMHICMQVRARGAFVQCCERGHGGPGWPN